MSSANRALFDAIAAYLGDMDLGGLFSIGADGTPGGWLWQQITSGIDNQAALMINLEQTSQFQQRYGVINDIRQQAAQGKPVHVPTVAEVREYEQSVLGMMRQAGLPDYLYDSYDDAHALMRNGLSAVEVEQRLGQAWDRVQNTDPQVRQAFSDFYGVSGDANLAAMFLDPSRTMASLERQSRAAYTAGMGQRMGINVDQAAAERIAGLPKTDAGIYQDLTQVNQLEGAGVFNETMAERNDADLTAATTGIDATVFGDGKAQAAIERRTIERKAANSASTGGALRTNVGVSGLGTA